jgi:RNA polymerase sigma-70 factor (ECF subfamily)
MCAVVADDAVLVRACLAGDAVAVRSLIERYQSEVFGLCLRLLHHRHDAEDVTQEVFLRIFRSLHRWDASRPLRPWLIGITINQCRTWLAKKQRLPESADYLHQTVQAQPKESNELVGELHAALAELRQEYRLVFVLFHEQGRTYEEIASLVQRPVGTVKTWLHRARLELLERLRRRGMVPTHLTAQDGAAPPE